jgi:16S rRNA A1518/A1519 N6-dimethyltransferase RsmA/KsgA/DIM1 with predicted DNA glycosylase/AP lyase activity
MLHHQMLGSYARHDYSNISAALNLTGNERVVDAGGGLGVLADILLTQQPKLNLVVLDRPEVIELASTAHTKSGATQFNGSPSIFLTNGVSQEMRLC